MNDYRHRILSIGGIGGLLSIAYGSTLAPGLSWANGGSDGGDLITATASLGVAHPSGYPTYVLLARAFQALPVGDLAFRSNLFSAWCAIVASCCVYFFTINCLCSQRGDCRKAPPRQQERDAPVAASVAALALAFSPLYWSQAVIAEVYSLNALFVGGLLLFTLENVRRKGPGVGWSGRLQSLVVGLSLGNHLTVALPAAAWFLTSLTSAEPHRRWPIGIQRGLWAGVGLLIYLYLPLRAASLPPVNWGNPVNWSGFWWVVSGQPYQKFVFGLPLAHLPERLLAWGKMLVEQFGGAGVIIGFVGVIYGKPEPAAIRGITIALAVGYAVFAIGYGSADSSAYLLPVYLIFAFWIGLGTNTLIIAGKWTGKRWKKTIAPFITVALIVWLLWRIPATMKQVDASNDNHAIHYATSVLSAAPEGAIILTSEDRDTFSLWYYHFALGNRPDVHVIAKPLLHYVWYQNHIQAIYPDLPFPNQWPWHTERANGHETTISPSGERLSGHAPVCSTTFDQKPFIDCKRGIE